MATPKESDGNTYLLDAMQFVTRCPELRDGLEKLNRNGYGYLTGISITMGDKTYILNRHDYKGIPSWDEIDAQYLKEHGRHFLVTPSQP